MDRERIEAYVDAARGRARPAARAGASARRARATSRSPPASPTLVTARRSASATSRRRCSCRSRPTTAGGSAARDERASCSPAPARSPRRCATRAVSASAMVEASLARIAATDPAVNAFTDVVAERARARGRGARRALAGGDGAARALPLAGVPFAVKNLFDVAGLTTRAGSKIERERRAGRASTRRSSRRLERAGAVLVGALNMDEYAYGFTTENTHDGADAQPARPRRASPAARRAARPPRSRPARCRSRSAPTPTARSACRRRCAASSA